MPDVFYTPEELATMLKVTRQAVYNWIQQGHMEVVRIGRTVRIPAEEVERLLREGRTPRKGGRNRPRATALDASELPVVAPPPPALVNTCRRAWIGTQLRNNLCSARVRRQPWSRARAAGAGDQPTPGPPVVATSFIQR
jgi:excisionase family DNA binding protein